MIAAGEFGDVRQVRLAYLQDWLADAAAPMAWRGNWGCMEGPLNPGMRRARPPVRAMRGREKGRPGSAGGPVQDGRRTCRRRDSAGGGGAARVEKRGEPGDGFALQQGDEKRRDQRGQRQHRQAGDTVGVAELVVEPAVARMSSSECI